MKIYSLEDVKKLTNEEKSYTIEEFGEEKGYTIKEFDEAKTKILKYVLYKKRSENEVIKKFQGSFDDNLILDVVDYLKENGYIDDINYIKRSVDEFIALKNLSIYEIKYKLISKGIKSSDVEDYVSNNYDMLLEYEKKSAKQIAKKKMSNSDSIEIKQYLMKKGYKSESIQEALEDVL